MQLEDGARLEPQVLAETVKSWAFAPPMDTPLKLTAVVPVFESVAILPPLTCPNATLPHVSDEGEAVMETAAAETPVPDRATVRGVELLPLVIDQEAVRVPEAEGVKVIFEEHVEEAPRVEPQVVDEVAKSEALAPEMEAELRVTVLEVVFETVIVSGPAGAPTFTLPKLRLPGDTATVPVLPPLPLPVPLPEGAGVITPHPDTEMAIAANATAVSRRERESNDSENKYREREAIMIDLDRGNYGALLGWRRTGRVMSQRIGGICRLGTRARGVRK